MNRKGVEFTVSQVDENWWNWRFQIGETVRTGKASLAPRLPSAFIARRRVAGKRWRACSSRTGNDSSAATIGVIPVGDAVGGTQA